MSDEVQEVQEEAPEIEETQEPKEIQPAEEPISIQYTLQEYNAMVEYQNKMNNVQAIVDALNFVPHSNKGMEVRLSLNLAFGNLVREILAEERERNEAQNARK